MIGLPMYRCAHGIAPVQIVVCTITSDADDYARA